MPFNTPGRADRGGRRTGPKKPGAGKRPAVSVIMPAYNTAPYIGEALASVFAQTFSDYEVIVINDGSPDTEELERVLAPYRSRIVYIKQENGGLARARNVGIRAARAPLVALLDSDDLWEPDYLVVQVSVLQRDRLVDIVYTDAIYFGGCAEEGRRFMELCPSDGQVTFEALLTQQCNVMVSVTARRSALIRAGLFDESLRSAEDYDLWLRIALAGGRISYHRRSLVRYRRRAGSLSADMTKHLPNVLRALDKLGRNPALTPREARLLKRQRRAFLGAMRFHEGRRHFIGGNISSAIRVWKEANAFLRSWPLALAMHFLRLAPGLAVKAYSMRFHILPGMRLKL